MWLCGMFGVCGGSVGGENMCGLFLCRNVTVLVSPTVSEWHPCGDMWRYVVICGCVWWCMRVCVRVGIWEFDGFRIVWVVVWWHTCVGVVYNTVLWVCAWCVAYDPTATDVCVCVCV